MASIGIFDSGSGGLSVYRELRKILPRERYLYFSDNAHCPYGEKSAAYIQDRARVITDILLGMGADIIVVACNTATAAAITTLREEYPAVPFIGMEPAVKPAALGTESGVIGVLATAGTLKGSKYLNTRGQYEDNVKIVEHVGQGFVELVEGGILDGPDAEATVRASLQPLLDAGADRIVLGCTHYPFLQPVIERLAGPGVQVTRRGPPDVARPSGKGHPHRGGPLLHRFISFRRAGFLTSHLQVGSMTRRIIISALLLLSGLLLRAQVLPGVEVLEEQGFAPLLGKRVGLVTNPSGVDRHFRSTIDILHEAPHNTPISRPDETTAARNPILKFQDTL